MKTSRGEKEKKTQRSFSLSLPVTDCKAISHYLCTTVYTHIHTQTQKRMKSASNLEFQNTTSVRQSFTQLCLLGIPLRRANSFSKTKEVWSCSTECGSHAQQSFKSTHIITLQHIVQILNFLHQLIPTNLLQPLFLFYIYTFLQEAFLQVFVLTSKKSPSVAKKKCIS